MKINYLFAFMFIVASSACTEDQQQFEQSSETGNSKNMIASTRSIEDLSTLIPNSITFENSDTLISENIDYRALNISFSSKEKIIAKIQNSNGNYVKPVEVWQNLIEVTNKSTNKTQKLLVSLIPDFPYYQDHKIIDWKYFKHLEKKSDFSGYEIRSDWGSGKIASVNYYFNGICLYHVKATDAVKYEFMESIFNQFGFQKLSFLNLNDNYKNNKELFSESDKTEIKKIGWSSILRIGVDDEDHGDLPPEGGDGNTGGNNNGSSGGKNNNNNYSITGNETLFTSGIITHYDQHSFESSPCTIVSLALKYNNINKSPLDIYNEAKAKNNGELLCIFKNMFATEDLKKVIGTNFKFRTCEDVKNAINIGHPLFSVYSPTNSSNFITAVLIVGYYNENLIVYDPESDSLKLLHQGIFDMNETFELISVL